MNRRSRKRQSDPVEEYREWVDNRYNPGHWLGANTPPDVKNIWSPKDRRWLGTVYVGTCVIGFGWALWKTRDADSLLFIFLVLIPVLIPGLIMLLARDSKKRGSVSGRTNRTEAGGRRK